MFVDKKFTSAGVQALLDTARAIEPKFDQLANVHGSQPLADRTELESAIHAETDAAIGRIPAGKKQELLSVLAMMQEIVSSSLGKDSKSAREQELKTYREDMIRALKAGDLRVKDVTNVMRQHHGGGWNENSNSRYFAVLTTDKLFHRESSGNLNRHSYHDDSEVGINAEHLFNVEITKEGQLVVKAIGFDYDRNASAGTAGLLGKDVLRVGDEDAELKAAIEGSGLLKQMTESHEVNRLLNVQVSNQNYLKRVHEELLNQNIMIKNESVDGSEQIPLYEFQDNQIGPVVKSLLLDIPQAIFESRLGLDENDCAKAFADLAFDSRHRNLSANNAVTRLIERLDLAATQKASIFKQAQELVGNVLEAIDDCPAIQKVAKAKASVLESHFYSQQFGRGLSGLHFDPPLGRVVCSARAA